MSINNLKTAALQSAAQRSTDFERQTSSGSICNSQSEVTSISRSQSIIVTIWEEYLVQRKEVSHLVRQVDEMQNAMRWHGIKL